MYTDVTTIENGLLRSMKRITNKKKLTNISPLSTIKFILPIFKESKNVKKVFCLSLQKFMITEVFCPKLLPEPMNPDIKIWI